MKRAAKSVFKGSIGILSTLSSSFSLVLFSSPSFGISIWTWLSSIVPDSLCLENEKEVAAPDSSSKFYYLRSEKMSLSFTLESLFIKVSRWAFFVLWKMITLQKIEASVHPSVPPTFSLSLGRGQFVPQVPTFCAYFLHTVKNSILIK